MSGEDFLNHLGRFTDAKGQDGLVGRICYKATVSIEVFCIGRTTCKYKDVSIRLADSKLSKIFA